ncbi:MAG: hypothetical protein KF878_10420 [Planctomycetes bacterium]|nr:hypothetical protein [Planctomycetota bacterium]
MLTILPAVWAATELVLLLARRVELAGALALLAAHAAACLCVGAGALSLLGVRAEGWAPRPAAGLLASALVLGQGLLGALWQTQAALEAFTPTAALLTTLAAALPGWRAAREVARHARRGAARVLAQVREEAPCWQLLAGALAALLLWCLFLTAHPPEGDALAYYLAQAKLVAETHRFTLLPEYEQFARIGFATEMHFALGYLLHGELGAKALSWTALASLALALTWLCAQVGLGTRGRIMALALLLSSSAILNVLYSGKSELLAAALGVAAVSWALEAEPVGRRALALAGLFAGLSIAAKLSHAAVLAPLLALIALWRVAPAPALTGGRARRVVAAALVGVGWTAVGLASLALKNWLVFGDPAAVLRVRALFAQEWYSPENTRWIVATYPLALVFGKYPMQYGNLSPLVAAFAPLALLCRRGGPPARRELWVVTGAAAVALVAWVAARPSILAPRYVFPPLLVGLVGVAWVAERLAAAPTLPLLRVGAPAAALAVLGLTVVDYRMVSAAVRRSHLEGEGGARAVVARWVREHVAPGERWLLASYDGYDHDATRLQCALRPDEAGRVFAAEDAVTLWSRLHELGARALVLDRATHLPRFQVTPDPGLAPAWLQVSETALAGTPLTLFALRPGPGAPDPRVVCVEARPGIWEVVPR